MGSGNLTTAWTRAALPLCLLGVLATEEKSYGYALLSRLTDAGIDGVKAATLYPALTRLEEEGAVEIEWGAGEGGPGRKYYRITDKGRARLHHDRTAWTAFTTTVAALTEAGEHRAPHPPTTTKGSGATEGTGVTRVAGLSEDPADPGDPRGLSDPSGPANTLATDDTAGAADQAGRA